MATVDDAGFPVTAAIDMMDWDEGGLYFLTAKGKSFYDRLKKRGTLALTGGTVVIDHGCGVKSYLFGLDAVKVQRGQSLARGEELGTTSEEHTLIWELRIGSKSVDPAAALTGSSGLLYRETM